MVSIHSRCVYETLLYASTSGIWLDTFVATRLFQFAHSPIMVGEAGLEPANLGVLNHIALKLAVCIYGARGAIRTLT